MENVSLQDLKNVVGFGLSVGELAVKLLDGIQGDEVMALIEAAQRSGVAISSLSTVIPSLQDADESTRNALIDFVKSDFDIADDSLEKTVETALEVAIQLTVLLKLLKKSDVQDGTV